MNGIAAHIEKQITDGHNDVLLIQQASQRLRNNGDIHGVMNTYRSLVETYLRIGLLQWRWGRTDPGPALAEAVKTCHEFHQMMRSCRDARVAGPLWRRIEFELAAVGGFVAQGSIDQSIVSYLAPWEQRAQEAWKEQGFLCYRFLNAGVVLALKDGTKPEGWDEFLAQVPSKLKAKLFYETYKSYMAIVDQANHGASEALAAAITQAAAHYRKRKTDRYFSGGKVISGGGNYNDLLVDPILGALIRRFLPDRGLSLTGDAAIHVWRW